MERCVSVIVLFNIPTEEKNAKILRKDTGAFYKFFDLKRNLSFSKVGHCELLFFSKFKFQIPQIGHTCRSNTYPIIRCRYHFSSNLNKRD